MKLDKIGYGTWRFGGDKDINPNNNDAEDIKVLQDIISSGVTYIDTAENYAAGKCEQLVGEAIKKFNRTKLTIASKVAKENLSNIKEHCYASLKRVGVKYFDLYYIHLPDPEVPITETAAALNELIEEGVIKNIGLSNASIETIKEYQKYLKYPIAVCQNQYNLTYRESEIAGVLDFCKKENIKFVAWRPLQIPIPAMGVKSLYEKGNFEILDNIADKYNKTAAQIAIKWLTSQENVHVIFNTRNMKHLDEILATESFEISAEDLEKLSKEFPNQKDKGLIPLV